MTTPQKLPGPPVSMIKTEPGTSRSPALRLPSFKAPRDMMLGGLGASGNKDSLINTNRKVYRPNLNLQRKKITDEPGSQTEQKIDVGRGSGRGRAARGRGERGRGRGRGRGTSDLVQTGGATFSEGLSASTNPRRSGMYGERGSGSGSGTSVSIKTRIKSSDYKMEDPKEDAARLAALLQDDFVDDPAMQPDITDMPTKLPTLKVKTEKMIKQEKVIKSEMENGLDLPVAERVETKPLPAFEQQEIFTMTQLLSSTTQQLVLLQLPDLMPQFNSEMEDKGRPSTSTVAAEAAASEEADHKPALPEGRVGTLQLLKSGRVRLVIGDSVMYTELGTHTAVKQDLILMDADSNTPGGDMINLGPIAARIISSPLYDPSLT